MEKSKKMDAVDTWLNILFGVLAIVALKSIFENDNSKIISKQGNKILSDEEKMNDINEKIEKTESCSNHHNIDIII